MKFLKIFFSVVFILWAFASAETIFIEAEDFVPSSDGWKVVSNSLTRLASKQKTLYEAVNKEMPVASIS